MKPNKYRLFWKKITNLQKKTNLCLSNSIASSKSIIEEGHQQIRSLRGNIIHNLIKLIKMKVR